MQHLLNYQTFGHRQDTALLLVHPLGTDLRFWEECVAIWKPRFYGIVPDLQAAGKSPRPEVPVTIPGHVADLERFVRNTVNVPRTTLVRHPMRSVWWIVPFAACLSVEWWQRRRRGLR